MTHDELEKWFASLREELETAYLAADEPWKQSGFSGPYERWETLRKPIADCVVSDGAFLDIGCANGYLLECLLGWTAGRGLKIDPWGLDISEKLTALARQRLPSFGKQIYEGNAFYWKPPRLFDYVRTELCYVPEKLQSRYVSRLIDEFLMPGGKLLVAEYRSRNDPRTGPWVDDTLEDAGFKVQCCEHGLWEDRELTRVAVILKGDHF
jgi:SAM-dependent methyltransferase